MTGPNVNCDQIKPKVRVARFLRPDLRELMYDGEPINECSLYRELAQIAQLKTLTAGETLILNFGLIDWFPSVFYRIMLTLRDEVGQKEAKLMVCCLPTNVREGFDLMGGSKTFEVRASEARAIADASKA